MCLSAMDTRWAESHDAWSLASASLTHHDVLKARGRCSGCPRFLVRNNTALCGRCLSIHLSCILEPLASFGSWGQCGREGGPARSS